ncbi:penicillin-binding protein activator [Kaarinaea lacus]
MQRKHTLDQNKRYNDMMTRETKTTCTFNLRTLTVAGLAILLASCGGAPTKPSQPAPVVSRPAGFPSTTAAPTEAATIAAAPSEQVAKKRYENPASQLIKIGRYLDAALLLSELAASVSSPKKQEYQLQIASLLLQGNYLLQAEQILAEINVDGLDSSFQIRKTLLGAQLALSQQKPEEAISQLNSLTDIIKSADPELQREFYNKQIDAFYSTRDFAGSAVARQALNDLIKDEEQIKENHEIILRDLQELSPSELSSLSDRPFDSTMAGWVALAYIAKTAGDETQAQQNIDAWMEKYPNHPVDLSILKTIISQQPEALGRPTQIALILPVKGRFAKAARAVQDGFLAGYYNQKDEAHKPKIRIYEEGEDPKQIRNVYDQAVSDGADFVVGPLNKTSVNELAATNDFPVPVLALNYSESASDSSTNLFQMSLSPEQEARQVAEHAWLDGHHKAAAIIPNTNWGDRVFEAFKSRWEELGGEVVEVQSYNAKKSDYGLPIKKLLNIDESEQRAKDIKDLINMKMEYEPRRRNDVDMIFMAAFSRQGRLLRPQLRFHRASKTPVYATSHVYSGTLQPNMDRDMNDVKFSDMPWTLSKNDGLKKRIEQLWPDSSKRYMRLYALGIDAFDVIPELNRLRRNQFSSYQGETGLLYIDVNNRLLRRLVWAQFVNGRPRVLDKF